MKDKMLENAVGCMIALSIFISGFTVPLILIAILYRLLTS